MSLADILPNHWLVLPLAVFGFLASLWLFVLVAVNIRSGGGRSKTGRPIRTWIDGKEVELILPPVTASNVQAGGLGGLFNPSTRSA